MTKPKVVLVHPEDIGPEVQDPVDWEAAFRALSSAVSEAVESQPDMYRIIKRVQSECGIGVAREMVRYMSPVYARDRAEVSG